MSLSALFSNCFQCFLAPVYIRITWELSKNTSGGTPPTKSTESETLGWEANTGIFLNTGGLLCTRLRIIALTHSELTPFLFCMVTLPKRPYFFRPPTPSPMPLFLADDYSSSSLFCLTFYSPLPCSSYFRRMSGSLDSFTVST